MKLGRRPVSARPALAFVAGTFLTLLLGALTSCARPDRRISPEDLPPVPAETRLPAAALELLFQSVRGIPLLEGFIVGRGPLGRQGPFRFLLDTGTTAPAVLKPDVVHQLGLPDEGRLPRLRGAAEEIVENVRVRRVPRLEIDGAEFADFPALELDLSTPESIAGTRIDGILGLTLFRDCLLTIDYPAQRVHIARGALPDPDGRTHLTLAPGTRYAVTVLGVGPHLVPLLIDSGDTEGLSLPRRVVARLPFLHGPVDGYASRSLGSVRRQLIGRLGMDARLGQHTFMRPVVSVAAGDTSVIGAQALAHFAVTFDQRRGVVRLARTETDPIRSPRVRSPGLGLTWEPGGPVVTDIIPGTPAARLDIQQGDRLLAVDGQAVEGLPHDAFEEMMEKSELVLVLDRGGRRIEVRVPVVDLVP
jgi:hypothetical protein